MPRIGLVLGAGGLIGQAYHSGVLAALQADLGWDARSAGVIVGTSAGALTGGLLRRGVPVLDLACWAVGHDWDPERPTLEALQTLRATLPRVDARTFLRPWRLPGPRRWWRSLRNPTSLRSLAFLSAFLPAGRSSLVDLIGDSLPRWIHDPWPQGLRICATRRIDGRRIVFGSVPDLCPPVPMAVAASSAIPGIFAPVAMGGVEYIDGGLVSPTNADLLAGDELDLVVIVSPMSGGSGPLNAAVRSFARRHLRAEVDRLLQAGSRVLCFEPGRAVAHAMGFNPMAPERAAAVVSSSFFEAAAAIRRTDDRVVGQVLGRGDRGRLSAA